MDDLKNELIELKQFIADLKADRAAAKEKEKREAWTKYVSLTVVIIAVLGSVAAQWSGRYSSRTQLKQGQASDKWNFYQAKSIKQHIFDITAQQLLLNSNDVEAVKLGKKLEAQKAAYDKDKAEIRANAEGFEKERDNAGKLGGKMGMAISFFSISIALATTCMLTKKKPLWFLAIALASIGVVLMTIVWMTENGYLTPGS